MTAEQLEELLRRAEHMLDDYQEGLSLKAYDVLCLLRDYMSESLAAYREASK